MHCGTVPVLNADSYVAGSGTVTELPCGINI